MKNITFENLSFEKCFELYDSETTLFYCDPPYVETWGTDEYASFFGDEQQKKLIEILKNIKGFVVLSGYEHDSLKELLNVGWKLETKDFMCMVKNARTENETERSRTECLYLSPRVMEQQRRLF